VGLGAKAREISEDDLGLFMILENNIQLFSHRSFYSDCNSNNSSNTVSNKNSVIVDNLDLYFIDYFRLTYNVNIPT
jgi:hypothetical protein